MIYETNEFKTEILNTKDPIKWLSQILTDNDIERLENAIKNTYTKDDANEIIKQFNLLLELGEK